MKKEKNTAENKGKVRACLRSAAGRVRGAADGVLTPKRKAEALALMAFLSVTVLYTGAQALVHLKTAVAVKTAGISSGGEAREEIKTAGPQEPPLDSAEWNQMINDIKKQARSWRARTGIFVKDLKTGKEWELNPDEKFRSASLIKVPIAVSVMEKVKAGELTLDKEIKISRQNRISGSGTLRWENDGTPVSVADILRHMITESDNTATRMMINEIGMDELSRMFRELGLKTTNITPDGMSLTSKKIKNDNYTTPREMAGLLERIYRRQLIDRTSSEYLLALLKRTKSHNRLKKGLPDGWELGHKTGLLRSSCHDAGIVFSPRGDYLIVVMTGEVPNYSVAKSFITSVGKLTYKHYMPSDDAPEGSGGRGKSG